MTEPTTHALDVPGAVLHYDIQSNDASTQPVLLLIGSLRLWLKSGLHGHLSPQPR